jgi:riboflavin transporter FmnP
MKKDRTGIFSLALAAVFAALAYAATLVIHIKVGFLTFDAKDTVICFSGMLLGPAWSAGIAVAVSTVEMLSVSDTGLLGFVMNLASSLAFSLTGAVFYRRFRKFWSAVAGMVLAVTVQTSVMLVMNLIITPLYTGMSTGEVAAMIPKLLLPFNLLKSLLNASLVMAIYKPLSTAIRASGVMGPPAEGQTAPPNGRRTALVIAVSVLIAAACVAIMITVMKGRFLWADLPSSSN